MQQEHAGNVPLRQTVVQLVQAKVIAPVAKQDICTMVRWHRTGKDVLLALQTASNSMTMVGRAKLARKVTRQAAGVQQEHAGNALKKIARLAPLKDIAEVARMDSAWSETSVILINS